MRNGPLRNEPSMTERSPGARRLVAAIALFAAAGAPLLALVWEALNQLLGGHVNAPLLLAALPAAAVFALLLRLLSRAVAGLGAAAGDERDSIPTAPR